MTNRCPEPHAWFAFREVDGDDPLEAHLDECADCRGVAAMIARFGLLPRDAPTVDDEHPDLVPELVPTGASLGRYTVRGAVGAGGMGIVLEAYDPKLDRRVALKVMRRLSDDAGWQRARSRVVVEAQAMARMVHPNVVAIHDLVEVGDEQLIAMEYVDGSDLESWLAGGPRDGDRLRVLIEAARGLAAAHDADIVHRDIKPSNILIGVDGRARVSDFGLAALAGGADGSGRPIGTPQFAAPEVGAGAAADARSDQYSFAITAWRALYGDAPIGSRRGRVAHVLARALASDPAARWPSMRELVGELERAARPRSRAVIAIAAVVVASAAAVAVWLGLERSASAPACDGDRAAVEAVWSAGQRAAWAQRMRRSIGDASTALVASVDREWRDWLDASRTACQQDAPDAARDCIAAVRHQLAAFLDHAPEVTTATAVESALAGLQRPRLCLAPSGMSAAATPADPALKLRRRVLKPALDEAHTLMLLGKYKAALPLYQRVLELSSPDDLAFRAQVLGRKAEAMTWAGDRTGAVPVIHEALATAERAGDNKERVEAMIALLGAYLELGNLGEAKALSKVAETTITGVPHDPELASRLALVLGAVAKHGGDYVAAERHYRAAVAFREQVEPGPNQTTAGALSNLAGALIAAGKPDEGAATYRRSLAMLETSVGRDHPVTLHPINGLANLAMQAERLDEAIELFSRGVGVVERALGREHPMAAQMLLGLGRARMRRDHADPAFDELERARAVATARFGEHHPFVATAEFVMAEERDRRGERDRALPLLEHSVAAWDANGVEVTDAANARFLLAKYRWRAGQREQARSLASRARDEMAHYPLPVLQKAAAEIAEWLARHR